VHEAVYNTDGSPQRFAADFESRCDGSSAPLFGEIRWNSSIPFSALIGGECFAGACADLTLSQSTTVNPANAGKDAIVTLTATNQGPVAASDVIVTVTYDAAATPIWASPGCTRQGSDPIYLCIVGTLGNGSSAQFKLVLRKETPGSLSTNATVASSTLDPEPSNNTSGLTVTVDPTPAGVPISRYRLYSPVTLEHHFTTDLNEYTVLGASGGWVPEGDVGKVLNNPGSFNGVAAVPYYRLYNDFNHWHHWTTDPNEYYTLVTFPGWNGEGVDGYILPTATTSTTQLYRLVYPNGTGLHHWTIDANEYTTLIGTYGWIGEGGAGFVVQ
jgi:hypothetical protein